MFDRQLRQFFGVKQFHVSFRVCDRANALQVGTFQQVVNFALLRYESLEACQVLKI